MSWIPVLKYGPTPNGILCVAFDTRLLLTIELELGLFHLRSSGDAEWKPKIKLRSCNAKVSPRRWRLSHNKKTYGKIETKDRREREGGIAIFSELKTADFPGLCVASLTVHKEMGQCKMQKCRQKRQ